MKIIDPIVGIITEPVDETCHCEPEEAAPVAWIELAVILGIAGAVVVAVLWLLF